MWLPKWFPNKNQELVGVYILEHARAFVEATGKHVVVLFCTAHEEADYLQEFSQEENITIYKSYYPSAKGFGRRLTTALRFNKAQKIGFKMITTAFGLPDLCHAHVIGRQILLAKRLKNRHNIPYYISAHWSGFLPERGLKLPFIRTVFYRFLARGAASGSAVSHHLLNGIRNTLGLELPNWTVIPNVVKTAPKPKEKESGPFRIMHMSVLDTANKQFDKILAAVQEVMELHPKGKVEFHVLGGNEPDIQHYRKEVLNPLKPYIYFHGWREKQDFLNHLPTYDFGVFLSKYETQSLGVLECLAAGVPCIVADNPAIQEYFGKVGDDTPGVMLPSTSSVEQLKTAILHLIDNLDVYTQNAKSFDTEPFLKGRVGHQMNRLYALSPEE